ncbi:MAG: M23 family metallopeptidase [Lachnospiraceae bacterium]|nr:M23 family metallopeptidase [Lachnospiraceae bacterium]
MKLSSLSKRKKFFLALGLSVLSIGGLTYSVKNIKDAGEKLANISKARNSLEENINSEISSNYALNSEDIGVGDDGKKDGEKNEENSEKVHVQVEKEVVEVVANGQKDKVDGKKLKEFDEERGLSWPISGDVIKNYSIDKLVYFDTLGVFKANPGIFIKAEEGNKVKAAYDGRIVEISKDGDRGNYIVMEMGSNMKLLYGQLKDIKVSKGDDIKEGEIIAQVAKPTAYYTKEGTHLYFQVMEDNKEVNPLILLK